MSQLPTFSYKIEKIDLTPYSGVDEPESLSEDGLKRLLTLVDLWVGAGWRFVDCLRDDEKSSVYYVHFEKTQKKET